MNRCLTSFSTNTQTIANLSRQREYGMQRLTYVEKGVIHMPSHIAQHNIIIVHACSPFSTCSKHKPAKEGNLRKAGRW